MTKISMKSRKEVIKRYGAKYKKSSKKEKGKILDGVCLATGLSYFGHFSQIPAIINYNKPTGELIWSKYSL